MGVVEGEEEETTMPEQVLDSKLELEEIMVVVAVAREVQMQMLEVMGRLEL